MSDYTPTTNAVRNAYMIHIFDGVQHRDIGLSMAEFDRWLAEAKAAAWDEAIDHAWELSDPASAVVDTSDLKPVCTESDMQQAKRENPHRTP